MHYIFPSIPKEDINTVLERTRYITEKAVILLKELKDPKNKENNRK